jgi:hypothetical protein
MRPSRGMGAIKESKIPGAMPNKMPTGKVKPRRDNTDFTQYKKGGVVKKKKGGPLDFLQRAPLSKMVGKK